MTASGWAWFAAAGVLAVIDWIAVGKGVRRLERIAKPLVLLALLGATLTTASTDVRGWLIAALAFGVLGDVALSFERQPQPALAGAVAAAKAPRLATAPPSAVSVTPLPASDIVDAAPPAIPVDQEDGDYRATSGGGAFLLGLTAFLIGHLCYLAAVKAYGIDRLSVVFGLLLVLIAVLSFGYRIIAGAHTFGGIPLTIGVTLYIVALGSVVVFGVATAELWIAAGVVLFAISDLILGYDRFVQARSWAPVAVICTYHVAQALIVIGLVS